MRVNGQSTKRWTHWLLSLLLVAMIMPAAKAMTKELISIETKTFALVYSAEKNQRFKQIYCGEKLTNTNEYNASRYTHNAYVGAGMEDLFEPAIRMIHNDGNPSLDLRYVKHTSTKLDSNVTSTVVTLQDPKYPVTVELHYDCYYKEDVVKAWTVVSHKEKKPVMMTQYASGMLHFDADSYWLTQFHGDWAKEMRVQETQLTNGIQIIDTKLGTRATMYQAPFFFLSLDKPAEETSGTVLAGTVAWSGNFQLTFEIDRLNSLRVMGGLNPYASEYMLDPGEQFETPAFIYTFTTEGKGQASRNLHRWVRKYNVIDGDKGRLTLLNNWEATFFDFDENKLVELFGNAKKLGVDMFLLDDGWFANKYPRNNDRAGLGDWQENKKKLPHGIGYLVEQAEKTGVKFGIWLEPEMVNPKSELYEQHPDWIIKLPNRNENYFRNQLVLDLTNPTVQQFVYDVVDDMMTKHPTIAFIKWDCNRMITNGYSPYLKDRQSHLYIDYVKGLYKVLEDLRDKYPHLPIMLCSGGGGRTDYGALKYFTEFWPSDNTDGLERVYIQWGFSYFFPTITMCNHITTMGKQSLKYRTDVAMMGKMGYDIRIDEMNEKELEFSQNAVKTYNRIAPVIWYGDLYRLIAPYNNDRAALMYVTEDKSQAIMFCYTLFPRRDDVHYPVKLQGLDANKTYKVKEINMMPGQRSYLPENNKTYSGDTLMKLGVNPYCGSHLFSTIIELTEVK